MRRLSAAIVGALSLGCAHASTPLPPAVGGGPFIQATASPPRAPASYTYAGLPWGTSADRVKSALASQGFAFVKIDREGDLNFSGTLFGYDAVAMALMANGALSKIAINVATPDSKARAIFSLLRDSLARLYGSPTNDYAIFKSPYRDGDGKEAMAIRTGQATIASYWLVQQHGRQLGDDISLEITTNLTVQVGYESNGWEGEANRRKTRPPR